YRAMVDDPAGSGNERLALQPVRDRDQNIHAVLVAVREPSSPPFSPEDQRLLLAVAEAWGPYIHQLALEADAADARERRRGETSGGEIFRQEAIAHMVKRGHEGDVVRVNPAWVSGAYWIVLLVLVAASVFGYFVHIHQYSQGPSVVRVTGRSEIISFDGGTVTGVEVVNGQVVKAGQVIARLHDTEQAVRLRTLEAEFERKLVAYLQTPADPNVRQALGQVVSERESAVAGVNARVMTAPHDGRVKDVRVGKNQRVQAGAVIASIARADQPEGLAVIAFLPGADRPRIRAKQPLRLTIPGYRNVHFDMEVRAISSEVLGAKEAIARYLGERLGDTIPIAGSVVVVEGRLETAKFQAEGENFELYDGMTGIAEVQLESRSVIETVIPGLRL
ncbi:MAG: biotin/lipoyl-binding protein, partial [Kofleriaceae bacterium]